MGYKSGWVKKIINGVSTKVFAKSHVKQVYYDYSKNVTLRDKLDEIESRLAALENKSQSIDDTTAIK